MGKGSLLNQYVKYAAATMSSFLAYALYSIVDGLFVSRGISEYAMSAINICFPYMGMLFALSIMFSIGTSTIIAIHLGEGKPDKANAVFSQNMVAISVIAVVLTTTMLVFRTPILEFFGVSDLTREFGHQYVLGAVPFSISVIVAYNMEVLVKTDGYPHKALIACIMGTGCNIVLDYIAIFILGMGTFGAGLATGISQTIVCIYYMLHFLRGNTTFNFCKFKFSWKLFFRQIKLGLSDGITEACGGIMILLYNRMVFMALGADGVVCYSIIGMANNICINLFLGAAQSAQPLISFNYGKGDDAACKKLSRYAITTAFAVGAIFLLAALVFGNQMAGLYLKGGNETLMKAASLALRTYSVAYLMMGPNFAISSCLTAREKPFGAMTISFSRGFVLQAAVLIIISFTVAGNMIFATPIFSEALTFVMALVFFKKAYKKGLSH